MRYIVKKLKEDYEFTHIEQVKTLDGKDVEYIKGKNVIKKDKLIESLEQLRIERKEQFEIIDNNIKELEAMLVAIENCK